MEAAGTAGPSGGIPSASEGGAGGRKAPKMHRMVKNVLSVSAMAKMWRGRMTAENSRSQDEENNRRNNLSHAVGAWDDMYFFMLDAPWLTVAGLVAVFYVVLVVGGTLPLVLVYLATYQDDDMFSLIEGGPSLEDGGVDAISQMFMFTASNIVTMGFGQHYAGTRGVFAIATVQQFVGMMANVFLFSVCVTKFQRAEPDIVFSRNALFLTRDDERCLLFRIGNLRCNFIYHPDVKATLLCYRVTKEGESFMQQYSCRLDNVPSVISGVFTFCHRVDDSSPFQHICSPEALASFPSGSLQLSISVMGRDAVFQNDIHAIKRYRGGEDGDFIFDRRFGDIMRVDSETDIPWVDFEDFHSTVPIAGTEDAGEKEVMDVDSLLEEAKRAHAVKGVIPEGNTPSAPPLRSNQSVKVQEPYACLVPRFAHVRVSHSVRPSFDEPDVVHFITAGLHLGGARDDTPMIPECPFTAGFVAMAKVMGVKHTLTMVRVPTEMGDALRSAWFKEMTGGKGETPALVYNGEVVHGSDAVREWFLSKFPEHAKAVAQAGQLPDLGDDPGMQMFLAFRGLSKVKAAVEDDDEGTGAAFLEGLRKTLTSLNAVIECNGGAFGEGGRLSPLDFKLAPIMEMLRCFEGLLPPSVRAANGGKRVSMLDDSVPALRSWHLRRMWPLLRDSMADHGLMELLMRTPRNRTMFGTLQFDDPEYVARIDAALSEWFGHGRISVLQSNDTATAGVTQQGPLVQHAPVCRLRRAMGTQFTPLGPLPVVRTPTLLAVSAQLEPGAPEESAAPLHCEFCV